MDAFQKWMEFVGTAVDGLGVLVVVIGTLYSTILFLKPQPDQDRYLLYRQSVGRSILLGLEFLVAGDIIRTVVVAPTIQNVVALGLVVLIRTFLSVSLEVELEGRWPWQAKP